jgi:hypothetical protein
MDKGINRWKDGWMNERMGDRWVSGQVRDG